VRGIALCTLREVAAAAGSGPQAIAVPPDQQGLLSNCRSASGLQRNRREETHNSLVPSKQGFRVVGADRVTCVLTRAAGVLLGAV